MIRLLLALSIVLMVQPSWPSRLLVSIPPPPPIEELWEPIKLADYVDLEAIQSVTIFRLAEYTDTPPHFYDQRIVDHQTTGDQELINDLLSEIQFEFERTTDKLLALCFSPRHAVSITGETGVVDILICYECENFLIYVNGKEVVRALFGARSEGRIDALMDRAGVSADTPNDLRRAGPDAP